MISLSRSLRVLCLIMVCLVALFLNGNEVLAQDTIEPYRGGIACYEWTTEKYVVLEPFRCGFEGLGQSEYQQSIGIDCRELNSDGQVINRFPKYIIPFSQVWLGCK